jgi:hypothetical protein
MKRGARQKLTTLRAGVEICPHCGADLTLSPAGADPPAAKPSLQKILLRWGVLLGVLLAAIWSFLWFIVPERQGNPTTQAEARAVASLRQVRTALADYAAAQRGAYPREFEALGEPVRTAAQFAQSVNYQLQYTPGPVEADGSIRSYALQARAGNYGFLSFYTDNSGAVHATRENRAATAQGRIRHINSRQASQTAAVTQFEKRRALSASKSTSRRGLYKTVYCRSQLFL